VTAIPVVPPPSPVEGGPRREKERVNILLVDDQPGKLLSYEAMLHQLDENLIKASSGREALEQLLRTDITVVLMDVSMPDLDGFELAQIIRQHHRYQKTAIIFVSAVHFSEVDQLRGYETGAVDYVSVPVVPELLRAKVGVFIELYRKRRESELLNRRLEQRVAERTAELEASIQRQLELADQLREADRRKDEFLGLLAHELRNPLAAVSNAVHIMRLKGIEDPAIRTSRDLIERQSNHLARLVDDLLDVSRIRTGKSKLRVEPVELAPVIADAIETSRPLIDARSHQLHVHLPEHPVRVEGDRARLTQVIANLLNNAAKYQHKGGRIDLTLSEAAGTATLSVRDRGVGLAPEALAHIFSLFWQCERSAGEAQGGLGIGLSLVRTLVEMHHGTVSVASEGAGMGSEFVVTLPTAAPGVSVEAAAEPVHEQRTRRKVLVVDDNRDAAESLATLLRLDGHDVHVAFDGPDALELAPRMQPDVILLDIGLPGLDGYEVCRRIRASGLVDAEIIAMTGYGQDRDRQRSHEAGFDRHTLKPVDIPELLSRLKASRG
jgi:signal transduction histidine kinase